MDDKNIYEKAYYYEIDRIDKIQSRMSVPVSILILISGAIASMMPDYFRLKDKRLSGIVDVLFILLILIFIISIIFTCKFYWPKKFGYIPSWGEIDKYKFQLNKRYNNNKKIVEAKVEEYYIEILKTASDINFGINDERMKNILYVYIFICMKLPLLLVIYCVITYIKTL